MTKLKGFTKATGEVKKRLIVSVCGLQKNGKTHFALTAPGPIAFFDTDKGYEGVVNKFVDNKKVYIYNVKMTRDSNEAEEEYLKFKKTYEDVFNDSSIRTIIIDSGTQLWELLRWYRFGKLDQVPSHLYGPLNTEFENLIHYGVNYDKNVIFLHKMKEEYDNNKATGSYVMSGYKGVPYAVQVACEISKNREESNSSNAVFDLTVDNCRQNTLIEGTVLSGITCDFKFLAMSVLPQTSMEDWE